MTFAILKSACDEWALHATLAFGLFTASSLNVMLLLSYLQP